MLINLKVKTLDAQTHEFTEVNNEITIREFKDQIAEKTGIAPEQQRIIYCGSVLGDDKHLKNYDLDGKVLHVAERPPPSQRASTASTSSASSENARSERPNRHNMRNSPLFRALDGMVVGTMAIPMNGGSLHNGPTALHPLTASSSFCMNRITVARHMLNCVNNIAAYLEDPSRGLNNVPLDILARGRWTMESTVVEVGITAADLPQAQNLVDMVQGANVTVVQLPTMFSSSDGDSLTGPLDISAAAGSLEIPDNNSSGISGSSNESEGGGGGGPHATIIVEDIIHDMDDVATNASSNMAQAGSTASSDSGSSRSNSNSTSTTDGGIGSTSVGTNTDDNIQNRRTGTSVLAEVFEQMRTVMARINPFIEQAQEMLQNEPTFDENDTNARENAQRLFDRVSEAFHYLSHAQHAISDLMLDYGQPTPRYLTCRPILVEQSGYVSSNNYISAAAAAAAAANTLRQNQNPLQPQTGSFNNNVPQAGGANQGTVSASPSGSSSTDSTTSDANRNNSADSGGSNTFIVEDPIDEPMNIIAGALGNNNSTSTTNNAGTQSNDNHQLSMARIIQAVVNSAPVDTEFHLQINAPSIVSFGVPVGPTMGSGSRNQRRLANQASSATNSNSNSNTNAGNENSNEASATTGGGATAAATTTSSTVPTLGNQARVNTATLPTTSTQTRSTSRPQVQIGNLPTNNLGSAGRGLMTPQMSAFDRFLPCNSHHIRDTNNSNSEQQNANNNENGNVSVSPNSNNSNNNSGNSSRSTTNAAGGGGAVTHNHGNAASRGATRILFDLIRRPSLTVGSTMSAPRASAAPYIRRPPPMPLANPLILTSSLATPPTTMRQDTGSTAAAAAANGTGAAAPSDNGHPANLWDGYCNNLRNQLVEFLSETLFEGRAISEANMEGARNRAISWFSEHLLYLRQYEKPEYDSQDSVLNILRKMWPILIEAITDRQIAAEQYESRIKWMCERFVTRLYSVLIVCIGQENADLFWGQFMRPLVSPVRLNLGTEACQFLLCFITTKIPTQTDFDDAGQFITHRKGNKLDSGDSLRKEEERPTGSKSTPTTGQDLPHLDIEMLELTSNSSSNPDDSTGSTAQNSEAQVLPLVSLPKVTEGSESWHNTVPNSWLPLLTRDVQFQAQQPPTQTPFSDGYISGMSAKRRKMIQSSKAPTDFKSLIANSVREAIQTVAISSAPNVSAGGAAVAAINDETQEATIAAVVEESAVQAACKDATLANIRERFKNDKDYEPDRFPQVTQFADK